MYPFETHSHTREHSACSAVSAEELITRAAELGLAGLVVTDHHFQNPAAELRAIADRVGAHDLVVLSAYEVTTVDPATGMHAGDLLVFGTPDDTAMEIWTPYPEACARARQLQALIISAHPFREGMGAGNRVFQMDIDGMEILNQNHAQPQVERAREAVRRTGLIGTAGSDAHRADQLAQFVTVFQNPVRTMDDFINELRSRQFTLKSNRPDIRWRGRP